MPGVNKLFFILFILALVSTSTPLAFFLPDTTASYFFANNLFILDKIILLFFVTTTSEVKPDPVAYDPISTAVLLTSDL